MSAEAKFLLRPQSGGDDFELDGEVLVGRKEDCDLVVSEGHPSRHHAKLVVDDDGVTVVDLGSANGTFVNGKKVDGEQRLSAGDRVAFDAATYMFVVPGEEMPTDATVLRSVEDLEKTMIRSADDLQKELEAAAPAAPQAGDSASPGSWADPENKGNPAGTQMFSREELAKMVGEYSDTAAAGDAPHLQVGTGPDAGAVIQLNLDGSNEWAVGSDPGRDIVLRGDGVSGFHAKIVHDAGRWKLVDQMSANGSFINNDKVVTAFLSDGDKIKFGTVECAIVFPGGSGAKKKAGASTGNSGGGNKGLLIGAATFVGVLVVLAVAYALFF